jgi:putative flippase GtrA
MNKDDRREAPGMTALPIPAPATDAARTDAAGDAWRRPPALAGLRRIAGEFLRFGVVGTLGFVVDTAVLYAGLALGLGPWLGRGVSYLVAASTTYALNRAWTFRGRSQGDASARQWALFLLVNLVGFAANYGTYALLITLSPLVATHPVLGVAAGSLAGLAANFTLSRRIVFRPRDTRRPGDPPAGHDGA